MEKARRQGRSETLVDLKVGTCILILLLVALTVPVTGQRRGPRRTDAPSRVPAVPVRASLTKEQKAKMSVTPEELALHRDFLLGPQTGITRLLPDLGCDDNRLVVKADAACLAYIPESSYYSFRKREHTIDIFADVRLKGDFLVSDGILSQGILVNLGDVGMDRVSVDTPGIVYLRAYSPHSDAREAQKQFERFIDGVMNDGFEYKKAVRAMPGATYAIRVVAYRGSIIRGSRGVRYDILGDDKRVDILVAFRIVGRQEDGAVTVIWRELERKASPKLKYQKRESKQDERN